MPITPDHVAVQILTGRHGLVSFAHPGQIELVAAVCHSFVLDNGAFSFWRQKRPVDWDSYYEFVDMWRTHPGCDWAVIPDVIDGSEQDNDDLLAAWPFGEHQGVPVWHLGESLERLRRLAGSFSRVALGSSAQFSQVGSSLWQERMVQVMAQVCVAGRPLVKLHGLRMLNPKVFCRYPFASADSSNIARNINIDKKWSTGRYAPPTKSARGLIMAARIEHFQSAARWDG